jgi:hypothetical protein
MELGFPVHYYHMPRRRLRFRNPIVRPLPYLRYIVPLISELTAMPKNDRNIWTADEDNRLRRLLEAGTSAILVAAKIKAHGIRDQRTR